MNAPARNAANIEIIAFDVDGTLVSHPEQLVIWELLNRRFTGDARLSHRRYLDYAAGKFDYATWVALDVGDWIAAGATREQILEEVRRLRAVPGASEVLERLRGRGYRLAVISGTIDIVLNEFFPAHPFEAVFTNRILFDSGGRLSGWEATPYDMDGKVNALADLAQRAGVPLAACAFVGDHVNDVAVAREAGFSIAFNPKAPEIEAAADVVVRSERLEAVAAYFPGRARR
ncbi:MAG: HAD family phosphatase [Planctomycetes bacterium]|nr:HAD family phosphatase [Planctomycetota bacterium]